jgi:hypothetical protein
MKKISFVLILFGIILSSCDKKSDDKFQWEAGISAPKYYPIGGVKVDLEYAGYSSLTNLDNGWAYNYGGIVSGEKYKDLPKKATIEYCSAVDNLVYKGSIPLPYDKILNLFKKYCKDKENDSAVLIVGMAPGGWIRVWFQSLNVLSENHIIEVTQAQLKGKEDLTLNEEFLNKNEPYWDKYKTYWQHFGIPLEAWASNEKKYNLYLNLSKPNPEYNITSQYNSLDGTLYFGDWKDDEKMVGKLPADLIIGWISKTDTISYDTHVLMPKNFTKFVENKKTKKVEIVLEIENNEQFGILYLITNNKKEKILRFKNLLSTSNKAVGDSNFSNQVEYFIK